MIRGCDLKKIGLFFLLVVILAACGSSENAVDIVRAQSVIDIDHGQILILLLVTLIFAALFVLAEYLFIRRLIRIQRVFRKLISYQWLNSPNGHWRKSEEPDLYQQMRIEQQWLLTPLFSQGPEGAETHDPLDLPHDGWI
jgi:hypothetical protein